MRELTDYESAGEIEKYVTKPGVCLKLDGEGAWWRDPDRPETVPMLSAAAGSLRDHGHSLKFGTGSGS